MMGGVTTGDGETDGAGSAVNCWESGGAIAGVSSGGEDGAAGRVNSGAESPGSKA